MRAQYRASGRPHPGLLQAMRQPIASPPTHSTTADPLGPFPQTGNDQQGDAPPTPAIPKQPGATTGPSSDDLRTSARRRWRISRIRFLLHRCPRNGTHLNPENTASSLRSRLTEGIPMGAIVIMGVSGCGKSTLGSAAAGRLKRPFLEGDDLHPPANLAKMAAGSALTDDDRWPWLRLVRDWIVAHPDGVVACSALRRSYRDLLWTAGTVLFAHIDVPADILRQRLTDRTDHWMPASLLDSQLAALEPLTPDEGATLDGRLSPDRLLDEIVQLADDRGQPLSNG